MSNEYISLKTCIVDENHSFKCFHDFYKSLERLKEERKNKVKLTCQLTLLDKFSTVTR